MGLVTGDAAVDGTSPVDGDAVVSLDGDAGGSTDGDVLGEVDTGPPCSTPTAGLKTHFVNATSGADTNDGLTPEKAWRTIAKVNAELAEGGSVAPGEQVVFARGETFHGGLVIARGGLDGSPTVLGSYGCGAPPVITGLVDPGKWTDVGGGVWESTCASCAASAGATQHTVVVDDEIRGMGRFPNVDAPNRGYLTIETHTNAAGTVDPSITDSHLSGATNWTGAQVVIRKQQWVLDRCPIVAHAGGTLTYRSPSPHAAIDGFGYFVQDDVRTLDQLGEWHFDETTHALRVYFGAAGPGAHRVTISDVDRLLDVRKKAWVTIRGLSLRGANVYGIDATEASHVTIEDTELRWSGVDGFYASSASFLSVARASVVSSLNDGIECLSCSDTSVTHSSVASSGMIAGMGEDNNGNYSGLEVLGGFPSLTTGHNLVDENRVTDSGYIGIGFDGPSVTVSHNFVQRFDMIKDDDGGIYTWGEDKLSDRHIVGNVVLDGVGAPAGTNAPPGSSGAVGIYLDDNSGFIEIASNTVAHCRRAGVFLHNAQDNFVHDNLLFDNTAQLLGSHQDNEPEHPLRRNKIEDNLFVELPDQRCVSIDTYLDDIGQFGSFDRNIYENPFAASGVIGATTIDGTTYRLRYYGPTTWHDAFGFDAASKGSQARAAAFVSKDLHANLIANGTMSVAADADRVFCTFDGCIHDWAASSPLDGGAARLGVDAAHRPVVTFRGYARLPAITAKKVYVVRFSAATTGPARTMGVSVLGDDYKELAPARFVTLSATRVEVELLVPAAVSASAPLLAIDLADGSNDVFLDNLQLYDADLTVVSPADVLRFEYNATNAPVTIPLAAKYLDVRGVAHTGSITLDPFGSTVLVKQ